MSSQRPSSRILLASLQRHNLTVKNESLQRSPAEQKAAEAWSSLGYETSDWLERTPFETALVFAFDTPTFEWLERLRSDDTLPDWHTIAINPDTSPIDEVEEWTLVSESKSEALAWVLSEMDTARAEPTGASAPDNGPLVIYGNDGPIASIERTAFAKAPADLSRRIERCLRGLRADGRTDLYSRKLSRIAGFECLQPQADNLTEPDTLTDYDNRQPLHITCANLCTALHSAIQPHVEQTLKRSVCQELLASYFGFDSWQHLRAREKSLRDALDIPVQVSQVTVANYDDYVSDRITAYRTLPEGLAALALRLQDMGAKHIHVRRSWNSFNMNSIERTSRQEFHSTGAVYRPGRYARCGRYPIARCESDEYRYLAACLSDSPTFEEDLRKHYATGAPVQTRASIIGARTGISPDDHLYIAGWHFFVNKRGTYPHVTVERIADIGRSVRHDQWCTASLHKAAIVQGHDSALWLAVDWDQKPEFRLDGLTESDAKQVEERFFAEENWGARQHPRRRSPPNSDFE